METHRLLFICTHNRCRSILCESIARKLGVGRIASASAGSAPAGEVYPGSLAALARHGYPIDGLNSESWQDKASFAPTLVITVCDSAAGESCPLWMGNTPKQHWGLNDPSKLTDPDAQFEAFEAVIAEIEQRVSALLNDNNN